jgi:hypothetical protein
MSDARPNGSAVWKVLAIALLTALLTGGGTLLFSGSGVQAVDRRLTVTETKTQNIEQRLDRMERTQERIEGKVDELLSRRPPR